MRIAIIQFPGSNCDEDAEYASGSIRGITAERVWHTETDLAGYEAVILPGGFAHGDYLRAGVVARFSPVMKEVGRFAAEGRPVLGICNGFQILLEAGILPGAMLKNRGLKFLCRDVHVRVETTSTPWTGRYEEGSILRIPIAHMEGNYYAPSEILDELEREKRVVVRYVTPDGRRDDGSFRFNPNGSCRSSAGRTKRERNVVGMMPHPGRRWAEIRGGTDGRGFFESLEPSGGAA